MNGGLEIDPAVAGRIGDSLAKVESQHGVKVVLAVEWGSRAFGFPSRDSDYDIRFVFVRPLATGPHSPLARDVITVPVADGFDVSGWELRKALQLALASNAQLLEWLSSPIIYRDFDGASQRLLTVVRSVYDLAALKFHYNRSGRNYLTRAKKAGSAIELKPYLHALRAALAIRWIKRRFTPPPMNIDELRAGLSLPAYVPFAIDNLIALRSNAGKKDLAIRSPEIDALFASELLKPVKYQSTDKPPAPAATVPALLKKLTDPSS